MAEQWNFAEHLQGPPSAVNAPNLLDQSKEIADTNLAKANTGVANANAGFIQAHTTGQDLSNQQAQLLLNQRQAAIDAWNKVSAAHEVNSTPANVSATPTSGVGQLPTDSSTGQPASSPSTSAPSASGNSSGTASHVSSSAYNTDDTMNQYWDQLMKSGTYTPAEVQSMRLGWQNNQSEATKKAADAESAIADVQQKKSAADEAYTKAQAEGLKYLGTSLLPVQKAIDNKDWVTANTLYTANVGHMADLAVHQASEAAGRPLTGPEAAAVRAQASAGFPPLVVQDKDGNYQINPEAKAKIGTLVGASEAGQAYYKTQNELASGQSTRALQAQEIEASKAKVINDKIDTAVKQGQLTASVGKDLSVATTNAQQAGGLVRLATQTKETDALLDQIRNTYGGSDWSKLQNVTISSLQPKTRALIQAVVPEAITGQGKDAKVNLTDIVKAANAKIGILDTAAMSNERVRGAMGSDNRARMAAQQAGEFNPLDDNNTWSTKKKLREDYADTVAINAQHAQDAENNQARLLIKAAKQGSPDANINENDYVIPSQHYKTGPAQPTPGSVPAPAVKTENGGKSKVIAGKTLTYNPKTGKIE